MLDDMSSARLELTRRMPQVARAMCSTPATGVALLKHAMRLLGEKRLSILHVEDDTDLAKYFSAALRDHVDFTLVRTLKEGIQLLATRHFDCVLLDLGLPDSQGLETLDAMARGGARIVIVSGTLVTQAEAREHGAASVILKGDATPTKMLSAIVEAVLS